jgi:hypothetical protein
LLGNNLNALHLSAGELLRKEVNNFFKPIWV